MNNGLIHIKGIKEGLLITFGEAEWSVLSPALFEQIEDQRAFFSGAKVALDVSNIQLKSREVGKLRDKLSDLGISLWALLSTDQQTVNSAQLMGLATALSKPSKPQPKAEEFTPRDDQAMWVNKTVRSGSRIEFSGNIVIVGDVNSGAEVIAEGSVVIWGKLRGVVHAGAKGNANAFICALDLAPTQLRIAEEVAVPPAKKEKLMPEIVQIVDGKLTAKPWLTQ